MPMEVACHGVYTQNIEALERLIFAVAEEKQTAIRRVVSLVRIAWAVSIIMTATAVGACVGWENHGLVGALALGFVGLIAGGFLSSPSLLLQVIA